MIEEDFCLHKLVLRDIRPTAIRVLVLRTLLEMKQAMSVSDLEAQLDTVDKSTIFRTLTLFLSHHLIHGVDDGSGTLKYAVCDDSCQCAVEDQHMHFCCECCHKTFCVKSIHIPSVQLPPGFIQTGANYVYSPFTAHTTSVSETPVSSDGNEIPYFSNKRVFPTSTSCPSTSVFNP